MIKNNIISLSGGKDSTAMLHMMLERGEPIHSIIFFDTGWEFPEMHAHIDLIEKNTGLKVWRLRTQLPFEYWMLHRPTRARRQSLEKCTNEELKDKWIDIKQYQEMPANIPNNRQRLINGIIGKVHGIGSGWPSPSRRWCTRQKVDAINKFLKPIHNPISCVGYAADETERQMENSKYPKRYPLIEYGITEAEALQYCFDLGYHWNGLYTHFSRVSCFCCPLQPISALRALRKYYPKLWTTMLKMDEHQPQHNKGFRGRKTVYDLDKRFIKEDIYNKKLDELKMFK